MAARSLVNRTSQRRRVGRIYVVRADDGLSVKRVGKNRAGSSSATTQQAGVADPAVAG